MGNLRARLRDHPWLLAVLAAWAGSRVAIIAVAWAAGKLSENHWVRERASSGYGVVSLLSSWDARWYVSIANDGYATAVNGQNNLGFFPLVGMIMRAGGLIGLGPGATGVAAANLACLAGLCAIAALTTEYFGPEIGARAAIYTALSPASAVLAMAYSEAFTLALGVGAVLALRRRRLVLAVLLGLAVGLSRGQGFLYALPLAVTALRLDGGWRVRLPALAVAATPGLALLGFMVYLHKHTGSAFAYADAQRAGWSRVNPSIDGLVKAWDNAWHFLDSRRIEPWYLRDALATALYLVLLAIAAVRRMPLEWVVFGFAIVLLPLAAGSVAGVGRYGLLALPIFWVLAWFGRSRSFDRIYCIVGPALIALNVLWLPFRWP